MDSLYVLVFLMFGAAILGLGFYMGWNKANARWNEQMRRLERNSRV